MLHIRTFLLIIGIMILSINIVFSQSCMNNIVPNPSLDDTLYCPTGNSQMDAVLDWDKPLTGSPTTGTSDYFNVCNYNSILPNSGTGYAGFYTYINFIPNAREYIQVQLNSPLIADECYEASMFVALDAGSGYAHDSIGMYFSTIAPPSPGGSMIAALPQVASTVLILDSNWLQITDTFKAAGGEEFLTIGVFTSDVNLNIVSTGTGGLGTKYMIDDVCVYQIDEDTLYSNLLSDTTVCDYSPFTFIAPAGYTNYSWTDISGLSLGVGQTLTLNPTGTDQIILHAYESNSCPKTVHIDTVNLNVVLGNAPAISTPTQEYCFGSIFNDLEAISPSNGNFIWYADSMLATVIGAGDYLSIAPSISTTYYVTETLGSCESSYTSIDITVYPLPIADAGSDEIIDLGSSTVLTGTGGISYAWSPSTFLSCTNCVSPVASPINTTTYTLIVTDSNGCTSQDMVTIIVETQLQDIFIPNVFSPNGDNNNDFFTIEGDGMTNFNIKIFNRWGELIFESDDQNVSWNGNHSGKSASNGVFAYTLSYNDNSGTPQVVSGNITVIK